MHTHQALMTQSNALFTDADDFNYYKGLSPIVFSGIVSW